MRAPHLTCCTCEAPVETVPGPRWPVAFHLDWSAGGNGHDDALCFACAASNPERVYVGPGACERRRKLGQLIGSGRTR